MSLVSYLQRPYGGLHAPWPRAASQIVGELNRVAEEYGRLARTAVDMAGREAGLERCGAEAEQFEVELFVVHLFTSHPELPSPVFAHSAWMQEARAALNATTREEGEVRAEIVELPFEIAEAQGELPLPNKRAALFRLKKRRELLENLIEQLQRMGRRTDGVSAMKLCRAFNIPSELATIAEHAARERLG
ncbi:hypothetical protein JCM10213_000752 [Rhodosporidiobolus nylandii]